MTPDATAADFDSILEKLTGVGGPGGGAAPGAVDPMVQMMMMQMQMDRADRAASRQTMMQMLGTLVPALLPLLFKKDADPVLMTLLQGMMAKTNDGEQTKAMLQMMAAGNQMTMEQMRGSLMSIMEMKDQQTKKMLEEASEKDNDGPASGPAALIHEIRMSLGSLVPLMTAGQPAAAPVAPAAIGHNPASATSAPTKQRAPVVVVMYQIRGIHTGEIKKPQHPAALAAMATIALQDPKLIEAFDTGDINDVVAYCVPFITAEPKLMAWIQTAGTGEWVNAFVENRLAPMIDVARDDGTGEPSDDDGDEPEELKPPTDTANTAKV